MSKDKEIKEIKEIITENEAEEKTQNKRRGIYSIFENIISQILWSGFFYLTAFNMCYNAGKSVLFLHMRVIKDDMTIVYILIALMIILLNNIVFKADRNLFVDISVGLIPTALTLSIYYIKVNLFAKAAIILFITFLLLGLYHIVKKDVKKSYTWTYVSLGIFSLIVCGAFLYCNSKLDYAYLYKPLNKELFENMEDVFGGFEYFARIYKDDLMDASEENLKKLCEAGDIEKLQELLQKLVNYEMLYFGVEDEVIVVIDNSLIGSDRSALEGNVIYINEDFVLSRESPYYLIYKEAFYQGAKYYYVVLANYIEEKDNESNFLYYRKMRAGKYYCDNAPMGKDTELLFEGFCEYTYGVPWDVCTLCSDVTEGLYRIVNGESLWH